LVVEVHGDFEGSLFMYRRIRLPNLYRSVMKHTALYSIKQADLLRAISGSTTEQVKRCAPRKRIVQFPTWTDIDTFMRSDIQMKQNISRTILYAGVLIPLKGVHHLINAFVVIARDFPSAELVIVGKEQNKSYAADLREQIRRCGLSERVRLLGPQPQSELARLMSNASVLVLPSKFEGLGRVIIEAMATGTPVIGSRVGGIPELVQDGVRGFLVPPGDENALAEKLRWILSNPDKSSAMGKSGRAFVAQLFSTENYVKGYKQIFEMAQPGIEHTEHAASPV
jgi:glycosyltransferase involved in cell wall biosynthesis